MNDVPSIESLIDGYIRKKTQRKEDAYQEVDIKY